MSFFATAGSKVRIGPALAMKSEDHVLADFTAIADDFVEIGSLTQIGTFGDTATPISTQTIGEARDKVLKGTRSAGTLELVANIDYADAGQIALLAAEKTPHNFAFEIEFADKPPGANAKNSKRYFIGCVMSAAEALDQANSVMALNASIAINSNIVRVNASAT